jgi:hypothetical protein
MEPIFMILGQSAATAAVLALEAKTTVQNLPYSSLRARLLADGQVLDLQNETLMSMRHQLQADGKHPPKKTRGSRDRGV